ncbi:hypothetical protein L7F22_057410 [Adiantum nelumboides]|nr:hypothetical protein [Adiantum nelumboides]
MCNRRLRAVCVREEEADGREEGDHDQGRGKGRQGGQEYICYSCGEHGHGMYFCPHPRRQNFNRGPRQNQLSPPRVRQPPPMPVAQAPPIQILQPSAPQQPPPPPQVTIPPLPVGAAGENKTVSVISLVDKAKDEVGECSKSKGKGKEKERDNGKSKEEDLEAMTMKRARDLEEGSQPEERRPRGRPKKQPPSKPQCKIGITDFTLGESSRAYDLVDDVSMQGPKITWPQLLHLAPKVRRQWTKMVGTRRPKLKVAGVISGRNLEDILPVIDALIKGQRVSNIYIDGGAQICVMNVDIYVMSTKGEGYPIILGRPWLMAIKAKQDWGTGLLKMQSSKGKEVFYNMKTGKQQDLSLETSMDKFSTKSTTTSEGESTMTEDSDSSIKVMGVILNDPNKVDPPDIRPLVNESEVQRYLQKPIQIDEQKSIQSDEGKLIQIKEQKSIQGVFYEVSFVHSTKIGQDISLAMKDTQLMDLLDDALEGFLSSSIICSSQHNEVCDLKPCTNKEDIVPYVMMLDQGSNEGIYFSMMENLELLPYDPEGVVDSSL